MSNLRMLAVGKIVPEIGTVIVTEEDALGPVGWDDFTEGMKAANAGAHLDEMTNADQVAGWFYSRRCVGSKFNEDDGSIEDDYDWIRGGC